MRIYLADSNAYNLTYAVSGIKTMLDVYTPVPILVSFFYYDKIDFDEMLGREIYNGVPPHVFADSGAFSAYSLNKPISIGAYADWLHRWEKYFCVYANLDDKHSWREGLKNLDYLKGRGLHPLPVYHGGEPLELLREFCQEYKYVALGGLTAKMSYSVGMRNLLAMFRVGAEYNTVFHGFGMTKWDVLLNVPFYTVDSSSWGQGHRYGNVPVWDHRRHRFLKLGLGDYAVWQRNARLVASLGFNWQDFADRDRNTRAHNCGLAALSYLKAADYLSERHGEIGFPNAHGDTRTPGYNPKYANGDPTRMMSAFPGLRLYLADATPKPGSPDFYLAVQQLAKKPAKP